MQRDEILDKLKLAFFVVVFIVGPIIFFIATADGSRSPFEEYDFIRR